VNPGLRARCRAGQDIFGSHAFDPNNYVAGQRLASRHDRPRRAAQPTNAARFRVIRAGDTRHERCKFARRRGHRATRPSE
jgi:hypothetical protein